MKLKKIRTKVIVMLIIINILSSWIASFLISALIRELAGEQTAEMTDLMRVGLEYLLTLIIFSIFMVIGVREVTAPVISLSKAANSIANGDFNVEIAEPKSRDEIGELQRSFGIMAKELKSTEYIQKDFINNVSHEFKTPLSIIAGNATLIRDGTLSPEELAVCGEDILAETEQLAKMTTNILMLSKLEHQGIQPQFKAFRLDEQLRQAAVSAMKKCEEKGLTLDVYLPPLALIGNEELLMHVWTNLLDNAVKFTPREGRIVVSVKENEGIVAVEVSDNGIGMDEETKRHIFNQFYQADASHRELGSGLGLTLVQRIADLHHATIEVESAVGIGTSFTVRLPKEQVII